MDIYKILMPYNFTPTDQKALDFVIRSFAGRENLKVTLFHTYSPLPEIDVKANPEIRKMMSGVNFLAKELKEKENGLNSAKEYLVQNGFSGKNVECVFKKKAKNNVDEILDKAIDGKYKVIVLSYKKSKATQLFVRSAHNKELSTLKNITVCIAT